jgi:hypothetical protein
MANRIAPTFAPIDLAPTTELDTTELRSLAGSVVHEFKERGYGLRHIIVLASELVGLACDAVRSSGTPTTKV